MTIPNKKRKQQDNDGMLIDDQNFESVLFEEMTTINSTLISLAGKVKLVDSRYFMYNSEMIDEFIGNVQEFLKQLDIHRKKVTFDNLNFDVLSRVYQFLDITTMVNCGAVSKMWRELMKQCGKFKVKVSPSNETFLKSSLLSNVTSLKLVNANLYMFKTLANCKSLQKLKILDLSQNRVNFRAVECLTSCPMPNLTALYMDTLTIEEEDAKRLLTSNFMANIKILDLSWYLSKIEDIEDVTDVDECFALHNFSEDFFKAISESKSLNQITRLSISNSDSFSSEGIDLLLKDMVNLKYLAMEYHDLTLYPNLFSKGGFTKLTHLDIGYCRIGNQDFANIIVSPNLPNLKKLVAKSLNNNNLNNGSWDETDSTVAQFLPNSKSTIEILDISDCQFNLFPSILNHCPKIKSLTIMDYHQSNNYLESIMKPCSLPKLQHLNIGSSRKEILEIIFTNTIYSNLRRLTFSSFSQLTLDTELVSKCTHLRHLKEFKYNLGLEISSECALAFKTNPTFSKTILLLEKYYEIINL